MNYLDITSAALDYADRNDAPVADNIDIFLRIVESRINKKIHILEMTKRATIVIRKDQEYYGFPEDFSGLRDIEIQVPLTSLNVEKRGARYSLKYATPEQMNRLHSVGDHGLSQLNAPGYYSIIANQLQIWPVSDGYTLEVVYFHKIPALTLTAPTNWLSEEYPEAYIQGLMVEINSFVKDATATPLWEQRFSTTIQEILDADYSRQWSGPALVMRCEHD